MESISQIFAELGDDRPDFAQALGDAYTALSEASWLLSDKGLNLEALNAALNDIAEINQAIADCEIESISHEGQSSIRGLILSQWEAA